MRPVLAVGALVLLLSGCGSGPVVVEGEPGSSPYDGPMSLPVDHDDEASIEDRSGAAGRALECDGAPYLGGGADYDSGLASAQGSAAEALENLFAEDFGWQTPTEGYRVERSDDGRVLLSYDVDGRTKAAFIAADDVEDWEHRTGWGVESWAQCDPAEFPASVTEGLGIDVWTTAAGARVPVTEVSSGPGPEHCDWDDITFLTLHGHPLGPFDEREEYLRDTSGELADYLRTTFSADADLPEGARNTGWRHDGRELWVVPDRSAAYLVSIDHDTDVETWPGTKESVACA